MTSTQKSELSTDIFCFSHLRWDFVYQRPQHLMSRFAKDRRVFFIEEPMDRDGSPSWEFTPVAENVVRCVPQLPADRDRSGDVGLMQELVALLAADWASAEQVAWFYTPMMLEWAAGLAPVATVYDCMDELSKFRFAPPRLIELENELFERADLVFTGGHSLYMAKKDRHASVHEFPSSIDAVHFRQARYFAEEMGDQLTIPRPRIGYAGVIDERLDLDLVAAAADARPDWNFIMLGPVVKIDPETLPKRENIHYLGMKSYDDLPKYLAGWDVGMMPFALNESTEFISPTKTPEYLAAGLPVVSTAITDVVRPYGELGLVHVAGSPADFVDSIVFAMAENRQLRLASVEEFLSGRSWDRTCGAMSDLIEIAVARSINSRSNAARPRASAVAQQASRVDLAA